jgi:integrase
MPRPRDTKPRCSDPIWEANRKKWRVIERGGDGPRKSCTFETEVQAKRYVAVFREELAKCELTIEKALGEYIKHQERQGLAKSSRETNYFRLKGFFRPVLHVNCHNLTLSKCEPLYPSYQKGNAAATHHGALSCAKTFCKWMLKEKMITKHPLLEVETEGKAKRGKPQLRLDEARKVVQVCAKTYLEDKDEAGLVVLLALLLGLRPGEVLPRKVRDIDDDGRVLVIDRGKTDSRTNARIKIYSEELRIMLKRQTHGKQPEDPLFSRIGRDYVTDSTRRLCKEAGVPEVTGQSLRGLHASLAYEEGTSPRAVANVLGHTTEATTKAHYATPGAVRSGTGRRVTEQLDICPQPVPEGPTVLH